ncbi:MAG: serine/threonine protein kinase [Trueperaceae bacterium]|nr:MAG: serine/threonine protein kinase [Trueperaceae bacterium]
MLALKTMLTTVRILADQGPVRVELARWRDRFVVVKRLQGFYPMLEERLRREAKVVSKLDHPNIVPLLATEGGALIYAYCPGVTLAEALEDGPLRRNRSVKIIQDVLSALAYAHKEEVIHCDVKPSNILIKGEVSLLTDFGFAKDLALTAITGQNAMLGTPNYMSPEQFQGVRTDPRSDLYAAGAVLYHMLTGEPPYGRQVLRFLVAEDSRLKLDPLPPAVSSLQGVIDRALTRDPEDRFQSAEEMLEALAAVPSGA